MQQIKWFCDCCKKETTSLATISINDIKQKPVNIGPRYNGLILHSDGITWQASTDYDLCSDCLINVKNVLKARENV